MKIASLLTYVSAAALVAVIGSLAALQLTTAAYATFTISLLALITTREYTPRHHFVVTRSPEKQVRQWITAGTHVAKLRGPVSKIALAR